MAKVAAVIRMSVDDVVELLAELVSIPSVNPGGREPRRAGEGEAEVARYLQDFWTSRGIDWQAEEVLPGRANVIARLVAEGKPTLILQTHMDTVAPHAADIRHTGLRIEKGRVYGRGACDAKASLAAMMHAVARAAKQGQRARSVIMAAAVDEEYQFRGAAAMVEAGLRGDEVVVGEPTGLDVVVAHKGAVRWRITTRGRAAHSSEPERGDNAIYKMARLVRVLERYAGRLQARSAESEMGPPTLSVGAIRGGDLPNVVPDACEILVDRRILPGDSFEAVEAELQACIAESLGEEFEYELERILADPPLAADKNGELAERAARIVREVGGSGRIKMVRYSSDASKFAAAGMAAVLLGPGDAAQAHAAEEWVEIEAVERAAEVYYRLIVQE